MSQVSQPRKIAGAAIVDDDGRIFIQRRSKERRLFPDTWDLVGGHLDPDESVEDALYREVGEETGWTVSHILADIGVYRYTPDDGVERVETDFLVRVDGDLSRPRLEAGKHTEFRWIGPGDIAVLDENRVGGAAGSAWNGVEFGLVKQVVESAFTVLRQIGLHT